MQWIRAHRDILLIVLVAVGLRLTAIVPLHDQGYTSDEKEYIALGMKLSHGEPFIDSNGEWSTKAPLWPFLLAALFTLFGEGLTIPHLLNAALGALAVLLGFMLGLEATGSRRAALAGAAVMALFPGLIVYSAVLQTETLYIVLVLCTCIWWERARRETSIRNGAMLGFLAGLAALTRAVFFGFFPVMLGMLVWSQRRNLRRATTAIGAAVLLWCLVLAPWTVRNYTLHGTFVPVSTWGGISLLLGNNPYSTGTWSVKPGFDEWLKEQAEQRGLRIEQSNERQRSALGRELAVTFITEHPAEALSLAVKKLYMFAVYPLAHSDSDIGVQAVCVAGDITLYVLAGLGFVALGNARRQLLPWFVAIVFFTLLHVVMHVEARYRLPVVPFIALLAGAGVTLLMDTQRLKDFLHIRRHQHAVGAWVTIVALVYAYTALQFFSGNI